MEHKHLTSAHGTVHYWISKHTAPTAKCLVFSHGTTADHSMFEGQLDYFFPSTTNLLEMGRKLSLRTERA